MSASIGELPSAVAQADAVAARMAGRTPAVFCDYDGTLTPIVDDPRDATLPQATREALRRLAGIATVAVVSGRDLADVRAMVGIDGIAYAGSHGFDILAPDGTRHEKAPDSLPALDAAQQRLSAVTDRIAGTAVERKRFAVAVHFRRIAEPERISDLEAVVDEAVEHSGGALRRTGGKKIFELRPAVDWNKGKALLWLLDVLGLDRDDVVPVYLGDDLTDEDAFEAIADRGIGIVVRGEDDTRPTAAHFCIDHPDDARDLLDRLAEAVAAR